MCKTNTPDPMETSPPRAVMDIARNPKTLFNTIAQNEHDRRRLEAQRSDIDRKLEELAKNDEFLTPFARAYLDKLPLEDSVVEGEAWERVPGDINNEQRSILYRYHVGMLHDAVWARPVYGRDSLRSMSDSEIDSVVQEMYKGRTNAKP